MTKYFLIDTALQKPYVLKFAFILQMNIFFHDNTPHDELKTRLKNVRCASSFENFDILKVVIS